MENSLWNPVKDIPYKNENELYLAHILEQYKIYIESTEKNNARRNSANVFFLTLNTTMLGVIGFGIKEVKIEEFDNLFLPPLCGLIILCCVWWFLLKIYRIINKTKFEVIGELEKKLPASPYYSAELSLLRNYKYFPLSRLEQFTPLVFIILHLLFILKISFT